MRDVELAWPAGVGIEVATLAVEEAIVASGLNVTLRDTLNQFPGCIHWHLKLRREKGILELTVWPDRRKVWLSVHRNRSAVWIDAEMYRLSKLITDRLRSADRP